MFAKRFFFVCAGVFLLALSYHLGASSAAAQSQVISAVGFDAYARPFIAVGHSVYELWDTNEILTFAPVPGTSPIVGLTDGKAILENGDVYQKDASGAWSLRANFFGTTPALHESWGDLKARYR